MKNLIIYILLLLTISCKRQKENSSREEKGLDSISYFLKELKDSKVIKQKKVKYNSKLLKLISKSDNNLLNRKRLDTIIESCFNLNDWYNYNKATNILLANSTESKDYLYLAKANRYKGNYYYNNRKLDSSFYFYIRSEKLYLRIKDRQSYAVILLKKGIVQYEINEFLGADISLSTAYNILKETNDNQRIIASLNSIGLNSKELKDYDKAIDYYNRALEIVKKKNLNPDEHQEAICYNNLGLVYQNLKDYKTSIYYFNLAIKDLDIYNDDPELYSNLIDNLAYSKLQLNDKSKLLDFFLKSLKIRSSLGNKSNLIASNNHLSEFYLNEKDTLKAVKFAEISLKLAKESKISENLIIALKQASLVDKKNSSLYSQRYIHLSDSLQIVERKNRDRFARIELETDELRQENTQLSEQNRDILNYFMIAIVFGGFLFFARFQRLKARELALKQTQQQANEEIYRLIISHQNQLEEGRDLEKKRISKELHDGVLGRLFGLRLNLDGLNNFDDAETKQQRLEYLNELKIIEQDLREISHELSRENLVLINNFVAIINNLLEQQTKINTAKINTLISDKIDWEKVSNTIKINLYRILQESLQNINKHAEAKTINVIFNKDSKGNLIFSVEDDGKGYNTNGKKTKGIGVNNIVERVHQCQGKIDIKSQIGKGTKIIITFPLENETINM